MLVLQELLAVIPQMMLVTPLSRTVMFSV